MSNYYKEFTTQKVQNVFLMNSRYQESALKDLLIQQINTNKITLQALSLRYSSYILHHNMIYLFIYFFA